jgi:Domain of unknown function (DUF4382)
MKILQKAIILFICILVSEIGCKKSSVDTNTKIKKLSVWLTDDPSQYDSVLVDIRFVEVKVDSGKQHEDDDQFGDDDADHDDDHHGHDQYGKWDTLSIQPGVYNILALRNGINMLLGTGNITGKIRKIRITLGTNNSVYVAGVQHPLSLYPGTNNYVYVKIHDEDEDDDHEGNNNGVTNTNIWLDFDVSRSVIEKNGQFYLKPVLKPFSRKHFGSIEGKVFPSAAHPLVSAYNSQDSAHAIPEDDGEYEMEGLHEGTYSVNFQAFNGYRDTTINNVVVHAGKKVKLPNITLSH